MIYFHSIVIVFSAIFPAALGSTDSPTNLQDNNLEPRFDNEFRRNILSEHNALRKLHKASPLRLTTKLCEGAQKEIERIMGIYEKTGKISANPEGHDSRNYNDNTWTLVNYGKTSWNASRVLQDWINQAELHDWSENYFDSKTGHFTQIVWKNTEEIGVGYTRGRTSKRQHVQMVLVRYTPQGNILDKEIFQDNVLPSEDAYLPSNPISNNIISTIA